MKVKDLNLWGTDLKDIRDYGRKYSIYSKVIYILDIVITILVLHTMFKNGTYFGDYVKFMLISFIICGLALNLPLKEEKYLTYKFLKKYGNKKVDTKEYKLSSSDLHSCLYKTYKSKLKKDDSVENYLDLANRACQKDSKFSRKFMKNLDSLSASDNGVEFSVYFFKKGNKLYYLNSCSVDGVINLDSCEVEKSAEI